LGTFGGPDSTLLEFQITVNNEGVVAAGADTSMPDPLSPHCFNFLDPPATDCFVQHGARFENGVLTDLGTLPGGYFSFAQEINDEGLIAGSSENGQTDPLTGTPAFHSVLWRGDKIIDLGALDGGSESQGIAIRLLVTHKIRRPKLSPSRHCSGPTTEPNREHSYGKRGFYRIWARWGAMTHTPSP
jgi:hypothetical protein